ncbi:MAG: amidase family protein, partial [Natronomonas sp.]
MDQELCFTPAVELASRIRRGDLSPVRVVEVHLDRIEERNHLTNAFVRVFEERARSAARDAERAVESGEQLGPLHGVPVAIKDLTPVAGHPTTFGSVPLANYESEDDAPAVARLLDAGAI